MPLYFNNSDLIQIKNSPNDDYNDLKNIPTINGILIVGDLSLSDLGISNSIDFKDVVDTKAQLPTNANKGDIYIVLENDDTSYIYTDSGWRELGKVHDLSKYVKKEELEQALTTLKIPNKLSDLENDINALTEIPAYYITQEQLSHVLTEHYVTIDSLNEHKNTVATKIDFSVLTSRLSVVEDKLNNLEKTNIEAVSIDSVVSLNDNTKDYILSGNVLGDSIINGKSVTLKDSSVNNAKLTINASDDITLKSVELTGAYPNNVGKVVTVNDSEYITIRDSVFNADSAYNMIEIGLSSDKLPKSVLIENCKFTGKYNNNAILIFGTQDNATININNCYFEDVSNCIRLSNRTNAKNVIINITNCQCDKWDSIDKWAGLLICQDYTSGSIQAEEQNNLFAPEKIIINISNLTKPNGAKLTMPSNISDICGTLDATTQVIYVWNSKGDSIPYNVNRYPKINIV